MMGVNSLNWRSKKVPVKTIVRAIGVTELSVTQEISYYKENR